MFQIHRLLAPSFRIRFWTLAPSRIARLSTKRCGVLSRRADCRFRATCQPRITSCNSSSISVTSLVILTFEQHSMSRPTQSILKSASSSGRWLTRQQSDPFVRLRAGAQGDADTLYRSRSSFKLQSLAKKYPCLLPKGGTVIDLGAAPGTHHRMAELASAYAVVHLLTHH
jgi:hypothetical protein